jgi:signal transduction histidine kinase
MFQETDSGLLIYLVGSIVILLMVTAIVTYAFLHQKKVIELRSQLHEEELLRRDAVMQAEQEGEEKERTRLAEELHDGIGAKLSGLKMNLEYLAANTTENKTLIEKMFQGISETLEEVRIISHDLQTYYYADKNIEQLLTGFMEQLSMRNGCRYDLLMNVTATDIDKAVKLHCWRIVTELLNNIHKHAKASLASVQISKEENTLEIVVEDNGRGFDKDNMDMSKGGLANISNRVKLCKGILNIDSSEKGTTVIIEIPLNTAA